MGNANNSLGIKTAVSPREVEVLRAVAANRRVIEVGSLLGFSTVHLAKVARSVESIDPHSGYPYFNPVPTLPVWRYNIFRHGVADRVCAHVGTAQEFLPGMNGELTFIDCTGFYDDTKFCLEHAPGIIACHDFGRRGCAGVERAVLEFVRKTGRELHVTDTLVLIT